MNICPPNYRYSGASGEEWDSAKTILWNIPLTGSWLEGIENSEIFKQWKDNGTFRSLNHDWVAWRTVGFSNKEKTMEYSDHRDVARWHGERTEEFSEQWKDNGTFQSLDRDWKIWRKVGFSNNEKTMEHSDDWMAWRTVGFSNNEKTMEYSDHRDVAGWHGKQRNFQNNEKTMEHSNHWIVTGRYEKSWILKQWNDNGTFWWLDGNHHGMENSGILKQYETTGSWLGGVEWDFELKRQYYYGTFLSLTLSLVHDWNALKTLRFSNNEKTMERSDHWHRIMTGWHEEN